MLDTELLQMIADDPRSFLRRNHKTEEQLAVKRRRLQHIWETSTSITQALKAVTVYTGPGDKTGDGALELVSLEADIQTDIQNLENIQRETAEAIRLLVADPVHRSILEAYYLSGMRWEEIAVNMRYAYRWVMRLHQRSLIQMQENAKRLVESHSNETQRNATK